MENSSHTLGAVVLPLQEKKDAEVKREKTRILIIARSGWSLVSYLHPASVIGIDGTESSLYMERLPVYISILQFYGSFHAPSQAQIVSQWF